MNRDYIHNVGYTPTPDDDLPPENKSNRMNRNEVEDAMIEMLYHRERLRKMGISDDEEI